MFEGSAAIPFMIRWPGQEPRIEKTPVTPVDIMPTFFAAAGLEPFPELPGMDLNPLLASGETKNNWQERVVFSEWLDPLPFRYLMARLLGLYTGIDIARGPEDWAFYIQVGSAWH